MAFFKKKPKVPDEWMAQARTFERIMQDVRNAANTGEGLSSGVQRLEVVEARRGGTPLGVDDARGHLAGEAHDDGTATFEFYLRGSNVSYAGTVAVTELIRRVASQVCTGTAYRQLAKGWTAATPGAGGAQGNVPRLLVPKLLCCVDKTMGMAFQRARTAVQAKLPGWWDGRAEAKNWCGMAIVQGARCRSLGSVVEKGLAFLPEFNFRGSACALGVLHALDMVLGNGDRVPRPNIGNVFVDRTGNCVAIDCDVALPPMGGNPTLWRHVVLEGGEAVAADAFAAWPWLIEVANFTPYTQNATRALEADVEILIHDLCQGRASRSPIAKAYGTQLAMNKTYFVRAALLAFAEIRKMSPELQSWFQEDEVVSGNSLLQKVGALAGVP